MCSLQVYLLKKSRYFYSNLAILSNINYTWGAQTERGTLYWMGIKQPENMMSFAMAATAEKQEVKSQQNK